MADTTETLIERSIQLRKQRKYEEALVAAISSAEASPDDANSWWQVSLNRWHLGDVRNALPTLRRTVELAPGFDAGWALLGKVLLDAGQEEEATEALQTAVDLDESNVGALQALSDIYARRNNEAMLDEELAVLNAIERYASLSPAQTNRIGILHFRRRHLFEAIKYWRRDLARPDDPANVFNLGLAYSDPEVSQDADAVDMWRLAIADFPEYEPPRRVLARVLPRLVQLGADARLYGATVLPPDLWHMTYLNPFQILNPADGSTLDDLDAKAVQRLRKGMLHELELEDGSLAWLPGTVLDRSRAIAACEELNDERKRNFHWLVYQDKRLLDFLGTGAHGHFIVDAEASPLDTIKRLDDDDGGFRSWLSPMFAAQYGKVLETALEAGNLVVLECLLDGRRWVMSADEDKCFEGARRMVGRMLGPLEQARERARSTKPVLGDLRVLVEGSRLARILNLLPTYFRDQQDAAAAAIRDIAITCFNEHGDSDLSREVLNLTKLFSFKSADLNRRLEEDFEKIDALIREERQHEAKKTRGDEEWAITKDGIRKGRAFIAAGEVTGLRWGVVVSREAQLTRYDFLLAAARDGHEEAFSWSSSQDIETNQAHFRDLVNAAVSYLLPAVVERVEGLLGAGKTVRVGSCSLSAEGIGFQTSGWFFSSTHLIPWARASARMENGDVVIMDMQNRKATVTLSARDVENATVLCLLVDMKNKR